MPLGELEYMKTLVLTTTMLSALAIFVPTAVADLSVCVPVGASLCTGYSLDHGKGAVCAGVVQDSFSGPYVVVCTGDDNCPTYYDVNGSPKGCTTDAGVGSTVFTVVAFVDALV